MKLKVFFDDNYLPPFKTLLYSAFSNKKAETPIEIVAGLWRDNLSQLSIATIQAYGEKLGFNITFEELGNWSPILDENIRNPYGHIPDDSAKIRLEYLVNSTEDFIYMDVDMLLLPGWDDIFQPAQFPTHHVIGVVPDSMTTKRNNVRYPPTENAKNARDGLDFYFNSGLMIVNAKAWHEKDMTGKLATTLRKISEGSIEVDWVDQDALNLVTAGFKFPLNRTFNTMIHPWTEEFTNEFYSPDRSLQPKILHFVASPKPWNMENSLREELLRLAQENARAGFVDSIGNWYHMYFFYDNQRVLWEQTW